MNLTLNLLTLVKIGAVSLKVTELQLCKREMRSELSCTYSLISVGEKLKLK